MSDDVLNDDVINEDGNVGEDAAGTTDERKEQPYLMPGTAEYEERKADLLLHEPFKPSDKTYEDLKKYNVDIQQEKREVRNEPEPKEKERVTRYSRQMLKRSLGAKLRNKAIKQAELTPQLDDDKRARKMPHLMESQIYNDGLGVDEYINRGLEKI